MKTARTTTRVNLDTRRERMDGCYPIRISVTTNGRRQYIGTGLACSRRAFDPRGGKNGTTWIKNQPDQNRLLLDYLAKVTQRIGLSAWNLDDLKMACFGQSPDISPQSDPYLAETLERMAATKAGRTRASYLQTARKVAKHYPDDIRMRDVTRAHLDAFANLECKTISVNSVALHLKNIRAAFNFAADMGTCACYPFRRYHIKQETTRKRALTLAQLDSLRAFNGTERENEARDIFMLSFYLIGINPVDLFSLHREDMDGGRIMYNRAKTGRFYSIKIHDAAQALLSEYKGEKSLLRVLDTWKDYTQYSRRVNADLRKIGQRLEGCPVRDLTLYWARHTWATMAAQLDVPDAIISQALGHTSINPVTAIYIDRDARKVDQANAMVVDYVLTRNTMNIRKAQ